MKFRNVFTALDFSQAAAMGVAGERDACMEPVLPTPSENQLWNTLSEIMPMARGIKPDERNAFVALVRDWLQQNREEEAQSTNIFRIDEPSALRRLIDGLPWNTAEEIEKRLDELGLPAFEYSLEAANWAFRHQAVVGDFLVGNELVAFRLIRFQPTLYLLLTARDCREIVEGFNGVFSRPPVTVSGPTLRVEEENWCGWVWETGEDPVQNQDALQRIRQIWEAARA
ncbi:MAG: hypothetical protein AB1439_03235 [candidate division FCPU426 bacterium]